MKRISAPAKPAGAPADEVMIVPTLALHLRCTQTTIYRLIKNNKIPAFKLGGGWRFSRSVIDEWIARLHETNPLVSGGRKSKLS